MKNNIYTNAVSNLKSSEIVAAIENGKKVFQRNNPDKLYITAKSIAEEWCTDLWKHPERFFIKKPTITMYAYELEDYVAHDKQKFSVILYSKNDSIEKMKRVPHLDYLKEVEEGMVEECQA